MKGTGGLIIVVLGLLILWLAVTGKLADMVTAVKQYGQPPEKPTSGPGTSAPPSGAVLSLAGVSALPGLPPLPVLPSPFAANAANN